MPSTIRGSDGFDSATTPKINLGTAVTASGTAVDFTGIPAGVKRVTVMFSGLSTNGSSLIQIQLGDSGGVENTGYSSSATYSLSSSISSSSTTGLIITGSIASATTLNGVVSINNLSSNTFVSSGVLGFGNVAASTFSGGSKTLSAELTTVRITTVNGTDTFDAGTINISWEF